MFINCWVGACFVGFLCCLFLGEKPKPLKNQFKNMFYFGGKSKKVTSKKNFFQKRRPCFFLNWFFFNPSQTKGFDAGFHEII